MYKRQGHTRATDCLNECFYNNAVLYIKAELARTLLRSCLLYTSIKSLKETDFYKKQHRVALLNCGGIDPENINEYIAVSYTHLDVYKRQNEYHAENNRCEHNLYAVQNPFKRIYLYVLRGNKVYGCYFLFGIHYARLAYDLSLIHI